MGISFKYPQEFVKEITDQAGMVSIITTGIDKITHEPYDLQIIKIIPAKNLNIGYLLANQREPQAEEKLRDISYNGSTIVPIFSVDGEGSPRGHYSVKMYTYQITPEIYAQISNSAGSSGTFCADGGSGFTIEYCKKDPQCVVSDSCKNFQTEKLNERSTTPEQLETALQIIETIKILR